MQAASQVLVKYLCHTAHDMPQAQGGELIYERV
jgi:hypothetical protein